MAPSAPHLYSLLRLRLDTQLRLAFTSSYRIGYSEGARLLLPSSSLAATALNPDRRGRMTRGALPSAQHSRRCAPSALHRSPAPLRCRATAISIFRFQTRMAHSMAAVLTMNISSMLRAGG